MFSTPVDVARPPGRGRRRGRRLAAGAAIAVLVVLAFLTAWVGIHALLVKNELARAVPLAASVVQNLTNGDAPAAKRASVRLGEHTRNAASLAGDPLWRLAEGLPWFGVNLTAMREAANVTNDVVQKAVMPLADTGSDFSIASLSPRNGAVTLAPLAKAKPVLDSARAAMVQAKGRAEGIATRGTMAAVASAVSGLISGIDKAARELDVAGSALGLLPGALGADGARNYLVLIQNPSELRATGGVAGAMAVLNVEHGRISLAAQASTLDFHHFADPVLTLPTETEGLYGPRVAQYIQNANLTPQFPLTGKLAATMWAKSFGTHIDGVLTVDPVALSYLLKATGPVTLATGDVLTSRNAVPLLLSTVYQRYPDPSDQDRFFQSAASEIFHRLTASKLDARALLRALERAGGENRILLWSARADEEKVLAQTGLAGTLPVSTADVSRVGVYLNDSTGSKMDYYLKVKVAVSSRICRSDGHPNTRVSVTMTNAAPADAATTLPLYVSGPVPGSAPLAHTRTKVAVYAPPGALLVSATSAGAEFPSNAAVDSSRTVAQFEMELAPGATKTVSLNLLEMATKNARVEAVVTPGLSSVVRHPVAPPCDDGVK